MGKDRGEVRSSGVDLRRPRRSRREPAAPNRDGEFARAFADALRDILLHERRRAA
jgi:hypothetical protein